MGRPFLTALNTVLAAVIIIGIAGFVGWTLGVDHEREAARSLPSSSSLLATESGTGTITSLPADSGAVRSDVLNAVVTVEQCRADDGKYPPSATGSGKSLQLKCGSVEDGKINLSNLPGEEFVYAKTGAKYTIRVTADGGIAWNYDSDRVSVESG